MEEGFEHWLEFPWNDSIKFPDTETLLNLCMTGSNSHFHLTCDSPGTNLFVFHWENFYIKKKKVNPLGFQRLNAIILLTEISTVTTFAFLNMVNILPTKSVEFLSLETYEIELDLVLKKMIVVLARGWMGWPGRSTPALILMMWF